MYLILALTALEGWYISSLNVKSAFLYGKLNKEIYIQQSNSSKIKDQEHKVLYLYQVIYGLKQATLI